MSIEVERFGDAALRVRLPGRARTASVLGALRLVPGVIDAVVAERHALVTFESGHPPARIAEAIERGLAASAPDTSPREHEIRVRYDGVDLDEVAARAGLGGGQVARLHAGRPYEVVAVGFLPGFAYLRELDPRLVGPRRTSPRPRIGALSVAIAGPYTGVYPHASPGGWNIIGTAEGFSPFDALTGAKLELGDTVRFVAVEP